MPFEKLCTVTEIWMDAVWAIARPSIEASRAAHKTKLSTQPESSKAAGDSIQRQSASAIGPNRARATSARTAAATALA